MLFKKGILPLPLFQILLIIIIASLALFQVSYYNYSILHTALEIFSIIIALTIFYFSKKSYLITKNGMLLFIGLSFIFVAFFDFLHLIAYLEYHTFPKDIPSISAIYWIAGRLLEAVTIYCSPFFSQRSIVPKYVIGLNLVYSVSVLLFAIWASNHFTIYLEANMNQIRASFGYLITIILIFSIIKFLYRKSIIEDCICNTIILALIFFILSESRFTLFSDTYGICTVTGHVLKISSYLLIQHCISLCGIDMPYKKSLHNIQQQFHKAFNGSINPMTITSLDEGRYIDVNESFTSMTGYTKEEVIGRTSTDINIWGELPQREKFREIVLANKSAKNIEINFRTKYGNLRFGLLSGDIINIDNNSYVFSIYYDITERKEMENLIKKSEAKYRELTNHLPVGIFEVDKGGKVTYANKVLFNLLGYNEEEDYKNADCLQIFIPQDVGRAAKSIQKTLNGKSSGGEEYKVLKKDGTTFPISIYSSPIIINDSICGMRGIIVDITEKKEAEAELLKVKQVNERLERLSSLATLSAGISHEINQPLNSLKIIVDRIMYRFDKGKTIQQQEIISRLYDASIQVDRIDSIIKNMRSLINYNTIEHTKPCNINEVIENTLFILQNDIQSSGVLVNKLLSKDLPSLKANYRFLEIIVKNLLVNALEAYDSTNKDQKEITLSTKYEDNIILEIIDNSTGISEEILGKIFDPFLTTKEVGKGMGLGLSIVSSIVSSLGGQIFVENNKRGGATFRLELPPYNLT